MTGDAVAVDTGRLWEIDIARTVAIGMMVVYHAVYDIDFLAPDVAVDPFGVPWKPLQLATGSSFLMLAGLSFWISNARARKRGLSEAQIAWKHARRGATLIGWGCGISLVTLLALGTDDYVRFGILHAIGACIVLAPFVVRLGVWNLALAAATLVLGLALADERSDVPGALILGLRPDGPRGVDYYPLLPWLAPFLLGIVIGALAYPSGRRGEWGRNLQPHALAGRLGAPGRRSLAIYLVHQPVLIALLAGILALAGVTIDWS